MTNVNPSTNVNSSTKVGPSTSVVVRGAGRGSFPVVLRTVYEPVTVHLVGASDEVRAVLRTARTQGTLVEHGIARTLKDGRVAVDVTLMRPVSPGSVSASRSRVVPRVVAVVAGVVVVTAGAGVFAGVLVVDWFLSHLPFLLGGLGVLVALVLLPVTGFAVKAKCEGLHCGGCQ